MILAIEAAIDGGSLALINGDTETAHWIGTNRGLRAEELLNEIDRLLVTLGTKNSALKAVAVSAGPGSFTGIRIGIATALGLKGALGISMISISALDAMAFAHAHTGVVAIPMGRGSGAAQRFAKGEAVGPPFTVDTSALFRIEQAGDFLVHEDLYQEGLTDVTATNFGRNIALAVGRFAAAHPKHSESPLFLSKTTVPV